MGCIIGKVSIGLETVSYDVANDDGIAISDCINDVVNDGDVVICDGLIGWGITLFGVILVNIGVTVDGDIVDGLCNNLVDGVFKEIDCLRSFSLRSANFFSRSLNWLVGWREGDKLGFLPFPKSWFITIF